MVERALSMREAAGSTPAFSKTLNKVFKKDIIYNNNGPTTSRYSKSKL